MSETNIDLLAKRYGALSHAQLPGPFTMSVTEGKCNYTLKAFLATGEKQVVDRKVYYTQVKDTLVVVLEVEEKHNHFNSQVQVSFVAHPEGGWVLGYPTAMRHTGLFDKWYRQLSSLMAAFERYLEELNAE